jgi:hypothetical protein
MIKWSEITSFHNVRKLISAYPELLNGNDTVEYDCKIKLHGTNAGVRCYSDGRVIPQSRNKELSPDDDNAGFAKFILDREGEWRPNKDIVIYGEWCGNGIMRGVAISSIPNKIFAVFAAKTIGEDEVFIFEPEMLREIVPNVPDVYILPWHGHKVKINWSNSSAEELISITDEINSVVSGVEKTDPWVKNTFSVDGIGEGLVYYPISKEHRSYKNFCDLSFKAKGEQHKNISKSKPAQLNPEIAESAENFAKLVLTEARLMQGANEVAKNFEMKSIGDFLKWIAADVQKECVDELSASNLTYKDVAKQINNYAKNWFIEKNKII